MSNSKNKNRDGGSKNFEDAANALKKQGAKPEEGGQPEGDKTDTENQPESENQPDTNTEGGEKPAEGEVKPEPPVEGESKPDANQESKPEEGAKPEEGGQAESNNIPLMQVPSAEQIEATAQLFADNPELLEACRLTYDRANAILAERNASPKLSIEEMEQANYDRLVATYGKDFVTAKRGTNKGYFSRRAWNQMGKNKRGWVEQTKVMPEVAAEGGKTEK